jgi:segregation and condensation protein B
VEQVAGGFRLATKPAVGALVRPFFRQRNRTRLSPAALETLAIVAYRQPATVPEIQAIRGVDPTGALKNLLEKKLVRILGRKKVVGNPLLYGTTTQFLVHFGLNKLEDLPSIEEFDAFVGALEETAVAAAPEEG